MGSWSNRPFGNDGALDWLADLERQDDPVAFIVGTLSIINADWEGDADQAESAIAAAAVISAAAVEPIGALYKDAKQWIVRRGFVPSQRLLKLARNAIDIIGSGSDLRDLWEESERLQPWLAQTRKLLVNLDHAESMGLPSRLPKRPGTPRLLYKLIDLYVENPSDRIGNMVQRKLHALDDPNQCDTNSDFKYPIVLTARAGLLEETNLLIAKGADVHVNGGQPFVHACAGGHIEVAELLRRHGAEIYRDFEPIDASEDSRSDKPSSLRLCVALIIVARVGKPEAADYLRSLGVDLFQRDMNDSSSLHHAAESGNVDMLEFLLDAGLDINHQRDGHAESALHFAARCGQFDAVALLLCRGADPNLVDAFEGEKYRWRNTALDVSTDEAITNLLISHGGLSAAEVQQDRNR